MNTHKHRKDELEKAQHFANKTNDNNQTVLLGRVYFMCVHMQICVNLHDSL